MCYSDRVGEGRGIAGPSAVTSSCSLHIPYCNEALLQAKAGCMFGEASRTLVPYPETHQGHAQRHLCTSGSPYCFAMRNLTVASSSWASCGCSPGQQRGRAIAALSRAGHAGKQASSLAPHAGKQFGSVGVPDVLFEPTSPLEGLLASWTDRTSRSPGAAAGRLRPTPLQCQRAGRGRQMRLSQSARTS